MNNTAHPINQEYLMHYSRKFKISLTYVLLGLLAAIFLNGCVPFRKTLLLRDKNSKYQDTIPSSIAQYKLQANDIISIQISSFNAQVSDFYNLKNDGGVGGFLVKKNGYVNIPMMDSMYVIGITVADLEKTVTEIMKSQIKEPYVVVRLVNFKVIFLGEVGTPGVISVKDNSISILEALAMAGDMSDLGNNTQVKLVRKLENGSNLIVKLDLTSKDIISSPYYFLHPNDIVYIEPLRVKSFRSNFQSVSALLSVVTLILVITNFVNNLKK